MMKTKKLTQYLALLTLVILFLAACIPEGTVIQPTVANTVTPAFEPTEIAGGGKTPVPIEPTSAVAQATTTSEADASPPDERQIPDGWQILDDDQTGYSLAFPPAWNVCQETKYSWTFCDNLEDPAWMGFPLRLYVSVFPNDHTNADWEVYNFTSTETIRTFKTIPVGESMLKIPGSRKPEYDTFTRLPDQLVAGYSAPVIENSKLWGIPSGTNVREVLMVTEDTTYILGMYYETPDQLAMFQQVLDSFQFPLEKTK